MWGSFGHKAMKKRFSGNAGSTGVCPGLEPLRSLVDRRDMPASILQEPPLADRNHKCVHSRSVGDESVRLAIADPDAISSGQWCSPMDYDPGAQGVPGSWFENDDECGRSSPPYWGWAFARN